MLLSVLLDIVFFFDNLNRFFFASRGDFDGWRIAREQTRIILVTCDIIGWLKCVDSFYYCGVEETQWHN